MRVIKTFVTYVPREKIPDDAKWFMQGLAVGTMIYQSGDIPPKMVDGNWLIDEQCDAGSLCTAPLSSDAAETVVTREELMRAYDLVEQGYTLWFGGECPVGGKVLVDHICDNGYSGKRTPANLLRWKSSGITAYRISKDDEDDDFDKCDSDEFGESDRYNRGSIECIDIIKEITADKSGLEAFCVGNVVKYLYRYKDKNGMSDVIKARNYLNKIIEGSEK